MITNDKKVMVIKKAKWGETVCRRQPTKLKRLEESKKAAKRIQESTLNK